MESPRRRRGHVGATRGHEGEVSRRETAESIDSVSNERWPEPHRVRARLSPIKWTSPATLPFSPSQNLTPASSSCCRTVSLRLSLAHLVAEEEELPPPSPGEESKPEEHNKAPRPRQCSLCPPPHHHPMLDPTDIRKDCGENPYPL
jgi:hypothetical protein